jgi:hypothetical protein
MNKYIWRAISKDLNGGQVQFIIDYYIPSQDIMLFFFIHSFLHLLFVWNHLIRIESSEV